MQYKAHLVKNSQKRSFTIIYLNLEKINAVHVPLDNLAAAFSTKNSPFKPIRVKKEAPPHDKKDI